MPIARRSMQGFRRPQPELPSRASQLLDHALGRETQRFDALAFHLEWRLRHGVADVAGQFRVVICHGASIAGLEQNGNICSSGASQPKRKLALRPQAVRRNR